MIVEKINSCEYEVTLYDLVKSQDYVAGTVRRNPLISPEDCDSYYWMFYPNGSLTQMCCGDLHKMANFINKLNTKPMGEG